MKSLTLFNNKGGVGKTTMTFNLAHMIARLGRSVVVIDCDPQCNLSALALSEAQRREAAAADVLHGRTVAACVMYASEPQSLELAENVHLLPGDLSLGRFEFELMSAWSSNSSTDAAQRSVTAFARLAAQIGEQAETDVVLFDVGSNLGCLNRAVLLACDAVVVPLTSDLSSMRGLTDVGDVMRAWRSSVAGDAPAGRDAWSSHAMRPVGYIVQQTARDEAPVHINAGWTESLAEAYARSVLGLQAAAARDVEDPHCLGRLRHFASLVPLAQAARKPIFDLKHADGVLGTQFQLVERARTEFDALARKILARLDER